MRPRAARPRPCRSAPVFCVDHADGDEGCSGEPGEWAGDPPKEGFEATHLRTLFFSSVVAVAVPITPSGQNR